MSTDQLADRPPLPPLDVALPTAPRPTNGHRPHTDDQDHPRVMLLTTVATDTIDTLLLLVAHGDHEAFDTLQDRITGLVRVNIRRILRDAPRSEAATQETFTDLLHDAADFDPHHDDALTWLLTRAHQHATHHLHTTDLTAGHPTPISLAH